MLICGRPSLSQCFEWRSSGLWTVDFTTMWSESVRKVVKWLDVRANQIPKICLVCKSVWVAKYDILYLNCRQSKWLYRGLSYRRTIHHLSPPMREWTCVRDPYKNESTHWHYGRIIPFQGLCPRKTNSIQVSKFPSGPTSRLVNQLRFSDLKHDSYWLQFDIEVNHQKNRSLHRSFITCLTLFGYDVMTTRLLCLLQHTHAQDLHINSGEEHKNPAFHLETTEVSMAVERPWVPLMAATTTNMLTTTMTVPALSPVTTMHHHCHFLMRAPLVRVGNIAKILVTTKKLCIWWVLAQLTMMHLSSHLKWPHACCSQRHRCVWWILTSASKLIVVRRFTTYFLPKSSSFGWRYQEFAMSYKERMLVQLQMLVNWRLAVLLKGDVARNSSEHVSDSDSHKGPCETSFSDPSMCTNATRERST